MKCMVYLKIGIVRISFVSTIFSLCGLLFGCGRIEPRHDTPVPTTTEVSASPETFETETTAPEKKRSFPKIFSWKSKENHTSDPAIDWKKVLENLDIWPAWVRLRREIIIPIIIEGRQVGHIRIPKGNHVRLANITSSSVIVVQGGHQASIAIHDTTLELQLAYILANPSAKTSEKIAARPIPIQPIIKKDTSSVFLALRSNWNSHLQGSKESKLELHNILWPHTSPDGALEITHFPEIKHGVTLMMPLHEALKKLHIHQIVPPPQSIEFPGIPFYYRMFQNPEQKSLISGEKNFNLIYVITDTADRVVALQYVCENPKRQSSRPNQWHEMGRTYNFINSRKHASRSLETLVEVLPSTQKSANIEKDILCIKTILIQRRTQRLLEIVHWYVPQRIASFIRHNLDQQVAEIEKPERRTSRGRRERFR